RTGHVSPTGAPRGAYARPAISPDGSRVALERAEPPAKVSIVVWDFARRVLSTVTRDSGQNEAPIWLPGGADSVVFTSRPQVGAAGRLFEQRADGTGSPTQISTGTLLPPAREYAGSVTPDGKQVIYAQVASGSDGINELDLATKQVQKIAPVQV